MTMDRLSNVLGAVSLAIADEIVAEAQKHVPRDDPAAGLALIGRSPGRSVRELSLDLQLSHAATVRLVDRLSRDGLVRRDTAKTDKRAKALYLTQNGMDQYHAMLVGRQSTLTSLLAKLTPTEQENLFGIAAKILRSIAEEHGKRSRICRFCCVESCGACPIHSGIEKTPS